MTAGVPIMLVNEVLLSIFSSRESVPFVVEAGVMETKCNVASFAWRNAVMNF